jgi:ATP/maltotriose-dependent transcriptional regulator MalT
LRSAAAWARASGEPVLALRLAIKVAELLSVRGSLPEARRVLDAALGDGADGPPELRAQALHEAAGLALKQGDGEAVRSLSADALRLAAEMDDAQATVRALAKLAIVALRDGGLEHAAEHAARATAIASRAGDDRARVNALNVVGTVALARERYGDAQAAFEEALELLSDLAATRQDTVATLHYNVALAAHLAGDAAGAARSLEQALRLYRSLAHVEGIAYCFVVEAARHADDGELRDAAESLTGAQRLLDEVGAALEPVEQSLADSTWALVSARLEEDALAAARNSGVARAEAELGPSELSR